VRAGIVDGEWKGQAAAKREMDKGRSQPALAPRDCSMRLHAARKVLENYRALDVEQANFDVVFG